MLQVHVIRCDEWEGVYVNGRLDDENHSIGTRDLPLGKPMTLQLIDASPALEDYVMEQGRLPKTLDEVIELLKRAKDGAK